MDLDELKKALQQHLGDGLVTIVGAGLSSAEGMPGMREIAEHLNAVVPRLICIDADLPLWEAISAGIEDVGLEAALLRTPPSATLEMIVMEATAQLLLPAEQRIIADAINGRRALRFTRLLSHLLKPTTGIEVVTPNYDRLIEFAAEQAGLGVDTMFVGNYCGALNERESRLALLREVSVLKNRNVRYRFRDRVNVYKPHGSLDWYQHEDRPIRHAGELPLPRLIITPGLNKFRNGYQSPFDKHRERANSAIDHASRYLILGYGFNDDHLETHLHPMIRAGKPTLLLTRTLSKNALALTRAHSNVLAFEASTEKGLDGTRLVTSSGDTFYANFKFWDVHAFIDEVLEP